MCTVGGACSASLFKLPGIDPTQFSIEFDLVVLNQQGFIVAQPVTQSQNVRAQIAGGGIAV